MSEKELFQQYFVGLQTYINSQHGSVLTTDASLHDSLPIVEIKPMMYGLDDETLDKSEMKFRITYQIDIYAKDIQGTNVDDVLFDLSEKVITYFLNEGFNITSDLRVPNIDVQIRRKNIRVSGLYDTLRNVIYRR